MLVSIDKIVRDACREAGDMDYKKYMIFLQYANDAYRDLTLYVIPSLQDFRVRTTQITGNQSFDLPADFVYETKVGICRNGHIAVLSLNKDLCNIPQADDHNCECQVADTQIDDILCGCGAAGLPGYTFYNAWNTNFRRGELYGMGLDYNLNGYYNIDTNAGKLILSGVKGDVDVILEYKSNGVGNGAEMIPTEAENAIREYILSKFFRRTDKGLSDRARRYYQTEYNKLKKLYSSASKDTWINLLWKNTKPTVK